MHARNVRLQHILDAREEAQESVEHGEVEPLEAIDEAPHLQVGAHIPRVTRGAAKGKGDVRGRDKERRKETPSDTHVLGTSGSAETTFV